MKGNYVIQFVLCITLVLTISCSGTRPTNLGVKDGQLAPCPDSPNCVSSQAEDEKHQIQAISFTQEPTAAWQKLIEVVKNQPRTTIIKQEEQYLYAEFKSALMGYVDDVEFYLISEKNIIEVRSASRLGYSDMGVNRKRIETIRAAMQKQ